MGSSHRFTAVRNAQSEGEAAQEEREVWPVPPPVQFETVQECQSQCDEKERKWDADHVRVQIGIGEAPVRKLVYCFRNDTAWSPEIIVRKRGACRQRPPQAAGGMNRPFEGGYAEIEMALAGPAQ